MANIRMISELALSLLRDDMSIDIEHLKSKLDSNSISQFKSCSVEALENFVQSLSCSNAKEEINSVASRYIELVSDCEFEEFIDSMRHAFVAYSQGGLRDLFLHQENQAWYPRVKLKHALTPNDIHTLCDFVNVYRGCDLIESNTREYGQSWTKSEEVAREFAFVHYSSQAWFSKASRCVLKATIHKDHVFYSDQCKHEQEVVVDTDKLRNVELCA